MFIGVYAVFFCLQIVICPSITWSRNWFSSDQWILRQVLKFKPCRAKHHAKRNRWCRSDNMERLITLLDFSPAEFKRSSMFLLSDIYFVTIIFSEQGWLRMASVWPSDAVPGVFTLRRYMWSSGSWQVFHGVSFGVFSHKPADYCIMIAQTDVK